MIINELIREYLIFNNYTHTLSVFLPETGQPERPPFDRGFITRKLNIIEDQQSKQLPLVYGLSFGLKNLVPENIRGGQVDEVPSRMAEGRPTFPRQEDIMPRPGEDIFSVGAPRPFIHKAT
eukprot:TRINITY_DN0_c2711_g1_i1.p1 TRINITY_DN0_c2711_g1~~TRINITY_DN0_c2711_g1_i1.p1  ORF type:complete len:121 (-),score=33.28 TRINITY_DN0_c2711_g1_i1:46-408(-)